MDQKSVFRRVGGLIGISPFISKAYCSKVSPSRSLTLSPGRIVRLA